MKTKKIVCILGLLVGIILLATMAIQVFELIYFNEKYYRVPDLKSYKYSEAESVLKNSDLHIKNIGSELSSYPIGEIFIQEPSANEIVKKGRTIKVWISKGQELVDIPNLVGLNLLDAKVMAQKSGLKIGNVVTVKSHGKYNEVLATDPATDTLLARGTQISFLVNGLRDMPQVVMPDVIGMKLEKAKDKLENNSLEIGEIIYKYIPDIATDIVLKTEIKAGEKVDMGSVVNITVNRRQDSER